MTAAAVPASATFAGELALDADGDVYGRTVSSYWSIGGDRVFGGYSAALTLGACATAARLPTFVSAHVLMLDAVRPGLIEISVEVLRRGRGVAAARATARQDGSVRLVTQCWMTSEPLAAPVAADESLTRPAPLDCPEIVFRRQELPLMGVISERAISYPPSSEQFHSGPPVTEVWARPGIAVGDGDLPISQMFDVMILDAHVLDAALRVRRSTDVLTASLDLGAMWHHPLEFGTWRRVRTECGPLVAGFVATSGTVRDQTGRLFVQATQQGRVRWPRS